MKLLSPVVWSVVALTCAAFFVGTVRNWLLTAPSDSRRTVLHLYSCAWAVRSVRINPLWRPYTSGRELLPWRGGTVLEANRPSMFAVIASFDLGRPFEWVSKAETFRVPFDGGWNMPLNDFVRW